MAKGVITTGSTSGDLIFNFAQQTARAFNTILLAVGDIDRVEVTVMPPELK